MNARRHLALALNPALILVAQGLAPDPWQQRLLLSTDPQILLNCSRQSGKSRTVSALAMHTALFRPGSLTLLLSPSMRQSQELFLKVMEGYSALGRPVKTKTGQDSQTHLRLVNGSRVVCLPGKEETIRSFSAPRLIVLDEASRVPDVLYRSVRPMLAVGHGRLVCLSTPFGRRGFFWEEWESAASWTRYRVTWKDCPRISEAFIARERGSLGNSWVAQEYECSFESLSGLVYPDFEDRCGIDIANPVEGRRVGGIDWGFRNPFAALWGRLDANDVLYITDERYLREVPLHRHAAALPKAVTWWADPAGVQEIEALRIAGFTIRRGINDIRAGIAAVTARIQTGRLKVVRAKCTNLLAEAKLYRYPTTKDGKPQGENPIDGDNHALAALRYLISRLDARFLAKYRRQAGAESQLLEEDASSSEPSVQAGDHGKPKSTPPRPALDFRNEDLWNNL